MSKDSDIVNILDECNLKKMGEGRSAEVYKYGENKVVKLYNKGWSDSWIDREYKCSKIIYNKGIAAPEVFSKATYRKRTGVIYQFIEGPSMMKEIEKKPWKTISYAKKMAELQYGFNQKEVDDLPLLKDTLEKLIKKKTALSGDMKTRLLKHLKNLQDDNKICHGDFHPDNILISKEGPVIIDWMSVTQGNPMGDVAGTWILFKVFELGKMNRVSKLLLNCVRRFFLRAYLKQYIQLSSCTKDDICGWVPIVAAGYLEEGFTDLEETRLIRIIKKYL